MTLEQRVLQGYADCALWLSTSDDGTPLDAHDISQASLRDMLQDIKAFLALCDEHDLEWLMVMTPEQFGHDFWLTRNRHGTGFWDRGLGELGATLTTWAHTFGDADLYVGDDGRLYTT